MQPLIRQLNDRDPQRRREAIIALSRRGDPAALDALRAVFQTDPDPELRALAKRAGQHIRAASNPASTAGPRVGPRRARASAISASPWREVAIRILSYIGILTLSLVALLVLYVQGFDLLVGDTGPNRGLDSFTRTLSALTGDLSFVLVFLGGAAASAVIVFIACAVIHLVARVLGGQAPFARLLVRIYGVLTRWVVVFAIANVASIAYLFLIGVGAAASFQNDLFLFAPLILLAILALLFQFNFARTIGDTYEYGLGFGCLTLIVIQLVLGAAGWLLSRGI